MAKDPAFLFYSNDFLTGTYTMTNEQIGKYIKLLCLQHQKGILTEKDMINICISYEKDIFDKFLKTDEGYYNERLKIESDKRSKYSDSRRNNRISKTLDKKTEEKICVDISESYVPHMENENTLLIDNNKINKESENFKNSNLFRQPNIPTKNQVWEFFSGIGGTKEMAKAFYEKHDGTGWFANNSPIVKWQSFANNFVSTWKKIEEEKKARSLPVDSKSVKIKLSSNPHPKYD